MHAGWLRGDPEAVKQIDRLLKQANYDWQVVEAEALTLEFDNFERFDRMIAQADARRNVVLREMERHLDVVARRHRNAVAEVEDAEFEDVSVDSQVAE